MQFVQKLFQENSLNEDDIYKELRTYLFNKNSIVNCRVNCIIMS